MKRYAILALALVLCCAMLTGCRRGNNNMKPSSPTNEATTAAPTMPTMMPETSPATEPVTTPTERETVDATGATDDTTGVTEDATGTTEQNRSRVKPKSPAVR